MLSIPKRLKSDAIAEALFEIRFEANECQTLPELVISNLAQFPAWSGYEITRLPSEIPLSLRNQHPELRYQPVLELRDPKKQSLAKIGVNVLSFHRHSPYPGWEEFRPEICSIIDFVFSSLSETTCVRAGLRYINLLTKADHGVNDLADLNYLVEIGGKALSTPQNLNYYIGSHGSEVHSGLVRIATPEFIKSDEIGNFSVIVDVDVFTPESFSSQDRENVKRWVDVAHDIEKQEFFRLFTEQMLNTLVEQ